MIILPSTHVQAYSITGTYKNLSGQDIEFSSYSGKPLVIESIMTTCPHCNEQSHRDKMNALYDSYSDSVNFLMVTVRDADTTADMQNFVNKYSIRWHAGFDNNNEMAKQFAVTGTPTMVLVDAKGLFVNKWVGGHDINVYVSALNELLSQDRTIQNTFSGGGTDEPSVIERLFTNPIFQAVLLLLVVIMIYVRSFGSKPDLNPPPKSK